MRRLRARAVSVLVAAIARGRRADLVDDPVAAGGSEGAGLHDLREAGLAHVRELAAED